VGTIDSTVIPIALVSALKTLAGSRAALRISCAGYAQEGDHAVQSTLASVTYGDQKWG